MSEVRKKIIKNTLVAFFGVKVDESENESENNNVGIAIDEVDVDILSEAINQALEKDKTDENTNQFKQ